MQMNITFENKTILKKKTYAKTKLASVYDPKQQIIESIKQEQTKVIGWNKYYFIAS